MNLESKSVIGINIGSHDSSTCFFSIHDQQIKNLVIRATERISKRKRQGFIPWKALLSLANNEAGGISKLNNCRQAITCFGQSAHEEENKQIARFPHLARNLDTFQLKKKGVSFSDGKHFVTHHQAHAYSALFQCPFDNAIILVQDGMGNYGSAFSESHPERHFFNSNKEAEVLTAYIFQNGELSPIYKEVLDYSVVKTNQDLWNQGSMGAAFELAAGAIFGSTADAGKVMGLSAYGEDINLSQNQISELLNSEKYKLSKNTQQDDPKFKQAANISFLIQRNFENKLTQVSKKLKADFPQVENLVLVGGCALNCVANAKLLDEQIYKNIFVPPFANDEGVSLGAAIAIAKDDIEFKSTPFKDIHGNFGAPENTPDRQEDEIKSLFSNYSLKKLNGDFSPIIDFLVAGEIIGWIQGRSEVGPRALGNRSILCSPLKKGLKHTLNSEIKFRESFRPFGITILSQEVHKFFEVPKSFESPFMSFAPFVRKTKEVELSEVLHVDKTCRLQTLHKNQNQKYYELIKLFEEKTGVPALVNTSLNLMGQPILETIKDAKSFLEESHLKKIVLGDYLIEKVEA